MDETGSGKGHLLGIQGDADEVAHGEDVVAAGAIAPEPHVATPLIALVASSLPEKSLLAGRTLIDRLGDQPLLPTQLGGEVGECRLVCLTMAQSVGPLAACWCAIDAAASLGKVVLHTGQTPSGGWLA